MRKSIKHKIMLGYTGVILAMTLIIIGTHLYFNANLRQARAKADHYSNSQIYGAKLAVHISGAGVALSNYLASRDRQQLQLFFENQKKARQDLEALKQSRVKNDRTLDELERTVGSFLDYLDRTAMNSDEMPRAQLDLGLAASLKACSLFLNHSDGMQQRAAGLFAKRFQQSFYITLVFVFLVALGALLGGYLITHGMTASLRRLMKGIRSVSAGQFQPVEAVNSEDEVAELVTAFNRMIQTIEKNELELQEKNEELLAQGEELSAQNEEILAQQDELNQALTNLTRQEELLSGLYQFSQRLTRTIELDGLVQVALRGLLEEARAEVGAFLLYEHDALEPKAVVGLERAELPRFRTDEGLAGRAFSEKKSLTVKYGAGQLQTRGLRGPVQMAHEIYLPLLFNDKALGLIVVGRTGPREFTAEEQKRLGSLADQVAVALRNALAHLEIYQTLKKLQEVDQLKSELINTVSHELRTPLASVLGFAELLLKKPPGEAKAQKYIATIYHESQRLTNLINNFLDLQRIENGRLDFTKKSVDLEPLLQSSAEIYRKQSQAHAITVEVETGLPPVLTDPDRVLQIIGNLLSNAIKYSPQGGPIRLKAIRRGAASVQVSVADQGLGIPKEARDQIFKPFYRVDNSERRQIGGTGLGLAICRRMVEILGGEIWFESEPGKGSVFHFTLPLAESPAASPLHANGGKDGLAPWILVVEDDPAMAEFIEESLQASGYATTTVSNGPEAMAALQQKPVAVILDLIIPGPFDGWEILRRLKQDAATQGIPVIISSCLDQREEGLKLGVADYLVKPFSPDKLVTKLKTVIQLSPGVLGLPESYRLADGAEAVVELLEKKGFVVKDVQKEPDLLVIDLDHPERTA
jgi:signal transduction histidine kinase/DNA-binding NarL/FixJ family response regulator